MNSGYMRECIPEFETFIHCHIILLSEAHGTLKCSENCFRSQFPVMYVLRKAVTIPIK
jgi:hypothetical protein